MEKTIRLGISACLLGSKVRFDGGHKWDRFITDTLGQYVEYMPVCPEAECGLGIPREPMRLTGEPDSPRLVTVRTAQEHTKRMARWVRKRMVELAKEGLSGFIFKARSPSCGVREIQVFNEEGGRVKNGVGIFARAFMDHFPLCPVEDEDRLHDPAVRENFIERIFVYKRWREMGAQKMSRDNLADFHNRHELLILAHSPKRRRMMTKLIAAKESPAKGLYLAYQNLLMEALRLKVTPNKNISILQHIVGCLKKQLSPDERKELLEAVDSYRQGRVPLIVPITLLNHYVRRCDLPYLKEQYYLSPHPIELQLRNHV
ncbi:MAG: YbgA family protein [Thermodesulfobacteriota bacterium]